MLTTPQLIAAILVAAACTFATRLIPFMVFGNRPVPKIVKYLGDILPPAIIGILIIYCIKEGFFNEAGAISPQLTTLAPQLIGIGITTIIHIWKKNTLLSISAGTITYMLLIHFVF